MQQSTFLPLVYLPGASGNSAVWRPIAERLSLRRTPVLVDYPGLGPAAAEPEIEDIDGLCRFVVSRLPPRFDLAALSMGCLVALKIALDYPDRVRRLVLATAAGGVDVGALGAVDWRPAFRARRPEAPTWFTEDRSDLGERLGDVLCPVLLVFGARDLIAPPAVGRWLSARLSSSKLEIVEGATHDLEEEQPDLLASLIEAHLRGR